MIIIFMSSISSSIASLFVPLLYLCSLKFLSGVEVHTWRHQPFKMFYFNVNLYT